MSFEAIKSAVGQPRVRCVCDDCGCDEVVAAVHGKSERDGEGRAAKKVQNLGWSYIGKRLRCPSCEVKRKVGKVSKERDDGPRGMSEEKWDTLRKVFKPSSEVPVASREQKREIISLLKDVYDVEGGAYLRGDTDDTVADVLSVRPGWVAELREEFFGPSGENADMKQLATELESFLATSESDLKSVKIVVSKIEAKIAEAKDLRARLGKVQAAVGPRLMRGVK